MYEGIVIQLAYLVARDEAIVSKRSEGIVHALRNIGRPRPHQDRVAALIAWLSIVVAQNAAASTIRDERRYEVGNDERYLGARRILQCGTKNLLENVRDRVNVDNLERRARRQLTAEASPIPVLPGRAVARTGLLMMPTFPPLSLKSRTAGFPQYGFKAGRSDEPSCRPRVHRVIQFACVLRALRCL